MNLYCVKIDLLSTECDLPLELKVKARDSADAESKGRLIATELAKEQEARGATTRIKVVSVTLLEESKSSYSSVLGCGLVLIALILSPAVFLVLKDAFYHPKVVPVAPSKVDMGNESLARAQESLKAGRFTQATAEADGALSMYVSANSPRASEARLVLARAYEGLKKNEEALKHYRILLELQPDDAELKKKVAELSH